eukprot:2784357-Pleurochrysis_carterae.AAC.1
MSSAALGCCEALARRRGWRYRVRAMKDEQRVHSEWFMRQRRELDTMRHSGGRHDTLFEQVYFDIGCALLQCLVHTAFTLMNA